MKRLPDLLGALATAFKALTKLVSVIEAERDVPENINSAHIDATSSCATLRYQILALQQHLRGMQRQFGMEELRAHEQLIEEMQAKVAEVENAIAEHARNMSPAQSKKLGRTKALVNICKRPLEGHGYVSSSSQDVSTPSCTLIALRDACKKLEELQSAIEQNRHWFLQTRSVLNVIPSEAAKSFRPSHQIFHDKRKLAFDFTNDENGCPKTAEGRLKKEVLNGGSHAVSAIGASGMGGVGKSCACRALAEDTDVQAKFKGGIYFMTFGQDATEQTLLREIAHIAKISGGHFCCKDISGQSDYKLATELAVSWFSTSPDPYLLVCDDLWNPSAQIIFPCVINIRDARSGSCLLYTTRQNALAFNFNPRCVVFDARDSENARKILLTCADCTEHDALLLEAEVSAVLGICQGLPVALAIAGGTISRYKFTSPMNESGAWERYLKSSRSRKMMLTGKESGWAAEPRRESLTMAIAASLEALDNDDNLTFLKYHTNLNFRDMFSSLCVLKKQGLASVAMLKNLWSIADDSVVAEVMDQLFDHNLAIPDFQEMGQTVRALRVHDLVHECACNMVQEREPFEWHLKLAETYSRASENESMLDCVMRKNWVSNLKNDGFVYDNLIRLLVTSGCVEEAKCILMDGQWSWSRIEESSVLGLSNDFQLVLQKLQTHVSQSEPTDVEGFDMISRTIVLSLTYVLRNPAEFFFQLSARLQWEGLQSRVIQEYLDNVEQKTPRPYIKPAWSFLPGPRSGMIFSDRLEKACVHIQARKTDFLTITRGGVVRSHRYNGKSDVLCKLYRGGFGIDCAVVISDGKRAVSGSLDKTICIWDLESGQLVRRPLEGHTDWVRCIAVTPDGKQVVSGSEDKTVRVWDLESGQQVGRPLEGHTGWVWCIAVTPDGKRAISGSRDTTIRVWDFESGQQVGQPLQGHTDMVTCIAVTPDGKRVVSGSDDKTVRVWDLVLGQQVGQPLEGQTGWVWCIAVTPDGKRAISGSRDTTIRVWDFESGQQVGQPLQGHTDMVTCIAVTPHGNQVVSGSCDYTVRVWDLVLGQQVRPPLGVHTQCVFCIAVTPEEKRVVSGSGDRTIRVWDLESGQHVGRPFEGHTGQVTCIAVTPDGNRVVSGSIDGTVRVWDLESRQQEGRPLEGHTDEVRCIAVTPDGKRAVSGSRDRTVRVWDLESRQQVGQPLEGHTNWVTCIAVTPNGKRAVSGSRDTTVHVWDLESEQQVGRPFQGHTGAVTHIAVTPNGKRVVSESEDISVRVWDLESGHCSLESDDISALDNLTSVLCEDGSIQTPYRICYNECVNLSLGKLLCSFEDYITSYVILPSHKKIVCGFPHGLLVVLNLSE